MTLVWVFLAGSLVLHGAGLLAMRAEGRRPVRYRMEVARLTPPLPPRREDVTAVPASHRSDVQADDTGSIPRHHHLDVDTLRRVLHEPTQELAFYSIVGTVWTTGERSILTGHIGRPMAEVMADATS